MERAEKALKLMKENYNCSQTVFALYADKFGVDKKDAFKIAAGFGGGIGRTQDICGALSGAVMVIGCRYFNGKDPAASKDIVYKKTKEFIDKFKKKNKFIDCYDLTGVDFSKENWRDLFAKLNVHEEKCKRYVKDACEILDEMI